MCQLRLIGLAACWGLVSLLLWSGDATAAAPTLDDIAKGLRARESVLFQSSDSFRIVYSTTAIKEHLPSHASGADFPIEFVVMRKGRVWRFRRRFLEPGNVQHQGKTIRVPGGTETVIVRDRLWLDWDTDKDLVFLEQFNADKAGSNFHPATMYFMFLGIDLVRRVADDMSADYDKIRKAHGKFLDHPFLPGYLEANKQKYRIHPDQEDVDGFRCWVVEYPGMDKF